VEFVSPWPLAVYLLSAAALAAGTIRLGLGLRRRDAALLILAPLVFVGPALCSGRTLSPIDRAYRVEPLAHHRALLGGRAPSAAIYHDPFAQILPWRAAVRHAYALGEWPLWNPFSRAGEPLAGLGQAAPYSPVNLLALCVPIEDEAALVAGVTLAIAGLGGFLALAGLGLSRRAALVGAVSWSSSGFLLFWHLWPLSQTIALFPFLLFAALRLARDANVRNAALLALALTLLLLTGHQESVAHSVLVSAVWAATALPWRQALSASAARREIGRATGHALAAGLTAAALAAFFILPHLDAIDQSRELLHRRSTPDRAFHARPLGEALALLKAEVVPFVWGNTNEEIRRRPATYSAALNAPDRAFSGGLILALALAGLAGSRRRLAVTGGALYLFGVLAGVGFRPLHELLARLPILDLTLNRRMSFLAAFGLSLLAAAAIEAWDSSRLASRRVPALTAVAAAALALVAWLFWPGASDAGLGATSYLLRTVALVAPAAVGVLLLLARPRDLIVVLLLGAHLAERRMETAHLFRPQERRAFFPRVAPLDAVPRTTEPARVVALRGALPPNTAIFYGFEDPRGDNALTLRRLARFRNAVEPGSRRPLLRFDRPDDRSLDLLNVRYVLRAAPTALPRGDRPIARSASLALFENRRALPRAFLPRTLWIGSDPSALLARVSKIDSFGAVSTIEPIGEKTATHEQENARGRLSTRRKGLGFEIEADLSAPGWIVVSEAHWLGWKATIAGRPLPLAYADHAFVGIFAPAGRSRIDLVYRPRAFVWGLRISAAALLLLLVGGATAAARRGPTKRPESLLARI